MQTIETERQLKELAHKLIQQKIAQNKIADMDWIVLEIINSQGRKVAGKYGRFWEMCTREWLKTVIKKMIDKMKDPEGDESEGQIMLKGYEEYGVRVAYPVIRNGRHQIVPTMQLWWEEAYARAAEYRAMAKANLKHAQGLEDFADKYLKKQQAA